MFDKVGLWTDAQRPVPRLWIRSAEVLWGGGGGTSLGEWEHNKSLIRCLGRTHGAPYRGYGYVPLRFGGGGGRR